MAETTFISKAMEFCMICNFFYRMLFLDFSQISCKIAIFFVFLVKNGEISNFLSILFLPESQFPDKKWSFFEIKDLSFRWCIIKYDLKLKMMSGGQNKHTHRIWWSKSVIERSTKKVKKNFFFQGERIITVYNIPKATP